MAARRALALLAAVSLAAPLALAQPLKMPKVELDYDKDVDFSTFKTYSWKDPAAAAKDPQMHTRIIWYVERALEKKGLTKAAGRRRATSSSATTPRGARGSRERRPRASRTCPAGPASSRPASTSRRRSRAR